jgi:hypothetical protein
MAERRLAAGFRRDFLGKAECNSALRHLPHSHPERRVALGLGMAMTLKAD